jgi:hypothetical protein
MDGCEAIDPRKFLDKCPPLNLALVVDTSSSMGVEVPGCPMAKLHHVKEGLKHVLKYLKEGDLVSLVSFADDATVILPPTEAVSHRHEITEAIEGLEAQGTTNLYEGLRRGAEMVRQNRRTLNRILLFTDGQPTSGIVDPDAITALAWNLFQPGPETDNGPRDLGTPDPESGISSPVVRGPWSPQADGLAVSLSVFGVGYNDLADRLLMEMTDARAGNAGSLHYINEMPMIGQMVFHDLLQVLLARQTTLEIELAGGARALETGLFLEKASETRLKGFLRHIDVYGTKTATALLWVPPTPAGSVPLGTLTVTYYDPDNRLCQEQLRLGLLSIAGPRADADPEDGSVTMTYQLQRARKSLGEALMADAPSTALEQLLDDQIQLDFGQIHLTDSLISWYI